MFRLFLHIIYNNLHKATYGPRPPLPLYCRLFKYLDFSNTLLVK